MVSDTVNKFLLHLPFAVRNEILECSEYVHLDRGEIFYTPGDQILTIDFPEFGVGSIVRVETDCEIEVATVGCEGFIGLGVTLSVPFLEEKAFCQVDGRSIRISSVDFLRILKKSKELRDASRRFHAVHLDQVSSIVVCNANHKAEQRCAKWLLFTRDRCSNLDKFNLTQEYLAVMLGLSRTGVNAACSNFQNAGLIRYTRGGITVLDPTGLEERSCQCYARNNAYRKAVMGY